MNVLKKTIELVVPAAISCSYLPANAPDACVGMSADVCGSTEDCPALCRRVEELACYSRWQIDADDGACVTLCESASPGLCPKLGALQESCEGIDRISECGR